MLKWFVALVTLTSASSREELRNIFTNRDLNEIWTNALQNLALGAFPSGFDVSSDLQLFWQFAFGAEYLVKVNSPYDDYLNGSQCIPVSKTRMVQQFWNESAFDMLDESYTDTYSFRCTIHDPFYAIYTLFFICLPGVAWWSFLNDQQKGCFCTCCCIPLIVISYPLVLLISKIILIFHNGKEFKRFCTLLTKWEVKHETRYQLIVQLFVIFTHSNKKPTTLQWPLASSTLVLSHPKVERFNKSKYEITGQKEQIARTEQTLPLFLLGHIFFILNMALLAVFIRYYLPLYLLILVLLYLLIEKMVLKGSDDETENEKEQRKTAISRETIVDAFFISILPIFVLTILVIIANMYNDVRLNVYGNEHRWIIFILCLILPGSTTSMHSLSYVVY